MKKTPVIVDFLNTPEGLTPSNIYTLQILQEAIVPFLVEGEHYLMSWLRSVQCPLSKMETDLLLHFFTCFDKPQTAQEFNLTTKRVTQCLHCISKKLNRYDVLKKYQRFVSSELLYALNLERRPTDKEQLLTAPIHHLELSTHLKTILSCLGDNLLEVLSIPEHEILKARGMGQKRMLQLKRFLKNHHLKLKP